MLASLGQVVQKILMSEDDLSKFLPFIIKAREYRVSQKAYSRQGEIRTGLLKDCEKTLDHLALRDEGVG